MNPVIWLIAAVILRAINQVFMKESSLMLERDSMSLMLYILIFLVVITLGLRSYCWQKALEYFPLSYVYPFSSLTIISLLAIGYYIYGESISIQNITGTALIIIGIIVTSKRDNKGG